VNYLKRNISQCLFAHHKSHEDESRKTIIIIAKILIRIFIFTMLLIKF